MQVTLAAALPVSNLTQPNINQLANMTEQQAHCFEMMKNKDMPMSDMSDCISECECCFTACVTSAVIIDTQPILIKSSLWLAPSINSLVSHPITIVTSLYRPPINA